MNIDSKHKDDEDLYTDVNIEYNRNHTAVYDRRPLNCGTT